MSLMFLVIFLKMILGDLAKFWVILLVDFWNFLY